MDLKIKHILLLALFCCSCSMFGQKNGELIRKTPFEVSDTTGLFKYKLNAPENFDDILKKVQLYEITYWSDGLKINGFMAEPKKQEKHPCIIYNRGGVKEIGTLNRQIAQVVLGEMAFWGYVVVASQLRGNGGSEGKEELCGRDINDVLNLIPLLSENIKADTSKIRMYGRSRGGMATYAALSKTKNIRAAVIIGGISDLFSFTEHRPIVDSIYSTFVPDYLTDKDNVLFERSAIKWPEALCKTTPLLVMHGSADWRVKPDDAFAITKKLYEHQHPMRFVLFEGAGHGLIEFRGEVQELTKNWFNRYVRDLTEWPGQLVH